MKHRIVSIGLGLVIMMGALWLNWPVAGNADVGNPWWDAQWPYRVSVVIDAAGYDRDDKVAEIPVNFTDLLVSVGNGGRFDPDSIRVLEVDGGLILDDAVPFQFDQAADYNGKGNAAGTLVLLMTGTTPAAESRTYDIYFNATGTDYAAPNFPNLVGLATITDPFGYETFRMTTGAGFYYYHKTGGGFASLLDSDAHDWISWNPATQDAGDSRGIPNMVHPLDGGYFHPGRTNVESVVAQRGPLKVSVSSTAAEGEWATVWDVFPTYARLTVEKVVEGTPYWLLAEGTPGGTLDPTTDLVTRSDGTTTTAGEAWTGDIPGEEWVYFTDPALSRSLFVIHHQEDELVDSYKPSTDKLMTVFGFGRSGNSRYLTQVPKQFSFGLVNDTTFEGMTAAVHNAYKPLDVTVSSAEERPFTPTPPPSPTPQETETPTPSPTPLPTETPTATATVQSTETPKPTNTPVSTATVTASPTPTATVSPTVTRPSVHAVYLGFVVGE